MRAIIDAIASGRMVKALEVIIKIIEPGEQREVDTQATLTILTLGPVIGGMPISPPRRELQS